MRGVQGLSLGLFSQVLFSCSPLSVALAMVFPDLVVNLFKVAVLANVDQVLCQMIEFPIDMSRHGPILERANL